MTSDELRTLRTRNKLSRARLAHIMTGKHGEGFSERSIENWEEGVSPILSLKAMALRKFLD